MAAAATKIQDVVSDDLNYEIWAPIVKATLTEKGLWDVVENGVPPDPSKIPELAATIQPEEISKWRDLVVKDMKALQILQSSLTDSAFRKTLSASSAKDVWDLLKKGNEEEALLRRLEKRFEELSMGKGETLESYLDRVMDIVEQSRGLKNEKADYEVITKVLSSLPRSYDCVAPLMDEYIDLKNMGLAEFLEFFGTFGSLSGPHIGVLLKNLFDSPISGDANNHNQEGKSRGTKPSKQRRGCKGQNQKDEGGEVKPEYLLSFLTLAEYKFDEDMWMIHTNTTNHMTPHLKFFTTLDRTHRARVNFAYTNGSFTMAEGRGDVRIMTKEGVKTIKNVLYVPKIFINALSVPQLNDFGYSVTMGGDGNVCKFTIKEPNRKLLGEAVAEERGFFLRFQVIEGNLTA